MIAYQDDGPSLDREIAALPAVRAVKSHDVRVRRRSHPAAPTRRSTGSSSPARRRRPAIVWSLAGSRTRHVGASSSRRRTCAEENGLAIGDTVRLVTLTPEQVAETGFTGGEPDGPTLDGVLVGLIDGPADLSDPTGIAVFAARCSTTSGSARPAPSYAHRSRRRRVRSSELRQQLDTIDGGDLLRLEPAAVIGAETRRAVDAQALGLWILAGLAGVVTIAALGQLLVRHTRLSVTETSILSSLGATRLQVVGETVARAGVIAAVAVALAAVLAMTASGIFPFGFVRRVEPDPGLHGDALVLGVGAARPRPRARRLGGGDDPVPPLGVAESSARRRRCRRGAMSDDAPWRPASGSPSRPATRRRSCRGSAVWSLMAAALVGTLIFAVSLERLVTEPARYGVNYDAMIDDGSDQVPPDQLAVLETDPDIADVNYYTSSHDPGRGAGATLPVAGVERVRGLLDPPVLAGRLPAGPEEIAIGRVSADRLDASIGDVLTLVGSRCRRRLRDHRPHRSAADPRQRPRRRGRTGHERGLPASRSRSRAAERRLPPPAGCAAGRGRTPQRRVRRPAGDAGPTRPPAIRNEARITYVPFVLAVLLAVLAVLLVMSGAYTTVRHRNHEVAVLRSLGAERGWLVRVVNWLAVASTLVPAVIGVPLGFIAGGWCSAPTPTTSARSTAPPRRSSSSPSVSPCSSCSPPWRRPSPGARPAGSSRRGCCTSIAGSARMAGVYDVVIVGGGSAGCVLANRLSADRSTRVLVLEAGRPDYRFDVLVHMPAALMLPIGNRFYDWKYESEPEPHMGGRRVYHARGKLLGGSSSINGMIFQRGNPLDYERWAADPGMETWDYAHCLPYFSGMEDCLAAAAG